MSQSRYCWSTKKEEITRREAQRSGIADQHVEQILGYICERASQRPIYFLWRPYFPDPRDELILELAVACGADFIVTFNARDFTGAHRFGIEVGTPGAFLRRIGESA